MRVEKVYKPNWADKMAGYLLIPVAGLPLFAAALVCSVFSKEYNEILKETVRNEIQ